MSHVIAVINEKGGVGKTMLSTNLAFGLVQRGRRVCLIDCDPSGDATGAVFKKSIPQQILGGMSPDAHANTYHLFFSERTIEPVRNDTWGFDTIGATDALAGLSSSSLEQAYDFADAVQYVAQHYDYVILDCPPSFGLIFTAAIIAAHAVLIPCTPEDLSVKAAIKVRDRLHQINRRLVPELHTTVLGVVINRLPVHPVPISAQVMMENLDKAFGNYVFDVRLSLTTRFADAIALGLPVFKCFPKHKAATQLAALVDQVERRLSYRTIQEQSQYA